MLSELSEIGECVVLLTATPIHLGSRDLFTLLHAMRPTEFRDPLTFDWQLKRFAVIHEVGRLVRAQDPRLLSEARTILETTFLTGVAKENRDPLAQQLVADLKGKPPDDRRGWIDLERRVQDLHPLATILTRTRKRDVQENAPVRRAAVYRCSWTDDEDAAYRRLVNGATKLGWICEQLNFGQVQRARQAASCLPAAVEARLVASAKSDDDAVELADILPSELGRTMGGSVHEPDPAWVDLIGTDSKYEKLRELLKLVWNEEPNAKILIFTFFVGTADYLVKRLTSERITCFAISGKVCSDPYRPDRDERGNRIRRFRDDDSVRVLVSTEVGSEGLDFQFCHHLVNYDLPWNPMVVEQRIGRIDRFGQDAKVVHIHNLVVEGTVEDRILLRLYDRIGIFNESIGELEPILGETISELQSDYVSGRLTPEEADRKVEQAARAINQRRSHLEVLERSAGELFGHEEYIREEMERVGRLGRYVSETAILSVLETYLESHHPACRLWKDDSLGVFGLRLDDSLRRDIQDAARGGPPWIDRTGESSIRFTTRGEVAFRSHDLELINVSHPLLKAAIAAVGPQLECAAAKIGQAVLDLNECADDGSFSGDYLVALFTHTIEGLRARRILESIAWSAEKGELLDEEDAERLLHLVLERGREWNMREQAPGVAKSIWDEVMARARRNNRKLRENEVRENECFTCGEKRHYSRSTSTPGA